MTRRKALITTYKGIRYVTIDRKKSRTGLIITVNKAIIPAASNVATVPLKIGVICLSFIVI